LINHCLENDRSAAVTTLPDVDEAAPGTALVIGTPSEAGAAPAIETPTAIIIPFPARAAGPVAGPDARLARALASLEAALVQQRAALAGWRDVLKDLKSTTTTLDDNLRRYRVSLRSLGGSVNALHQKAKALEAWADRATEAEGR
jgi:hypothetical protein